MVTKNKREQTWNNKSITILVSVAIVYGLWFNFVDSAAYCPDKMKQDANQKCVSIGEIIGKTKGDNLNATKATNIYQLWNVIGHFIPGLFLALYFKKRLEYLVAGTLISSTVMDSPLWGVAKLLHGLRLWHESFSSTDDFGKWLIFYYNPGGQYLVWEKTINIFGFEFPTAAMIFWSIVIRIILAILLISWQNKQEKEGKEFSLRNILLGR